MGLKEGVVGWLPFGGFSRLVGAVAERRWPKPVVTAAIRRFVKHFGVDMSEAVQGIDGFDTFSAFFLRKLTAGARPIDGRATLVNPADGVVVAEGPVADDSVVQAKGMTYSLKALLGEPPPFSRGFQVTIYLAPRDYHRVHTPCAGRVVSMRRLRGLRRPVGLKYVSTIENLFSENERVVFGIERPKGAVFVVMVGASGVSSIRPSVSLGPTEPILAAGDELGCFALGSTVVMVWDARVAGGSHVRKGDIVRVGTACVNPSIQLTQSE